MTVAKQAFPKTELAVKVSGIHWWYGTPSHAAENTAGYYNTNGNNAYADYEDVFLQFSAHFDFTCLEMTDAQQASANAYCEPQQLVHQVIDSVKMLGGALSGENALERYDQGAYDEILSNLRYG